MRSDGQTNHSEDPRFGPNKPNFLSTSDGNTITFFCWIYLLSNIHFDVSCTFFHRILFCLSSSMVWVLDVSFLYFFLQLSHFNFWANYNSMTRGPIHFPLLYSNFSWTPLLNYLTPWGSTPSNLPLGPFATLGKLICFLRWLSK